MKLKYIWFVIITVCFAYSQTQLTIGQQSNTGGSAQSVSNTLTGIMGQPSTVGLSSQVGSAVSSGYIPVIIGNTAGNASGDTIAPAAPLSLSVSPDSWTNINSFTLTWTNPEASSNIIGARYTIGDAPVSNIDGSLEPGLGITSIPNIEVSGSGDFTIYVWLVDLEGNTSFLNYATTVLRYDDTAPPAPLVLVADPPGLSLVNSFSVSWTNPQDLSDIAGAHYKIGTAPTSSADSEYKPGSALTTLDSLQVPGPGQYSIYVWLQDGAGNTSYLNRSVTSLSYGIAVGDTTAPEPPLSLSVTPNEWSSDRTFSLQWINPEDDSAIAGAYYSIGYAPGFNTDGEFKSEPEPGINHIEDLQVTNQGVTDIYVWLEDTSGNTRFQNSTHGVFRFDNSIPQVSTSAITESPAAEPVSITVNATDTYSGIAFTRLFYRKAGDISKLDSVNFIGNQASIPASIHTQRGSEYFIKAYDNANNSVRLPAASSYFVQAVLNASGASNTDNSGNAIAQHNGTTVNDYRIFSVPFDLDDETPAALLEDDLGLYDETKWKFFRRVEDNTFQPYSAFKDLSVVKPGAGFLIIVKDTEIKINTGSGRSVNKNDYDAIALNQGWNIIGNPYDFDIPLDSLKINNVQTLTDVWSLGNSGWSSNPQFLKKWEGLAIYSETAATLNIGVATGQGFNYSISDNFKNNDWGLHISAEGAEGFDRDNYIGVYSNKMGKYLILHEPPILTGGLSLRIKGDEAFNKGSFSRNDNLSAYIKPSAGDGERWELEILNTHADNKVHLDFTHIGYLPDGFSAVWLDKDLRNMIDLQDSDWQLDLKAGNLTTRKFRILIGSQDYIEDNSRDILIPQVFELQQNFPNPFNPSTTIVFALPAANTVSLEIFNILGQRVTILIKNQQTEAGYHSVKWDGNNDFGSAVSSGVYMIRLRSKSQIKIQKAILIR